MAYEIRLAREEDFGAVHDLLLACDLSPSDVPPPGAVFWVCDAEGAIVGCCGLELAHDAGLLRSVAVHPDHRRKGLAQHLSEAAERHAQARGLSELLLFTQEAGPYFDRLGWRPVEVAHAARRLAATAQVRGYDESGWFPCEKAFRLALPRRG